MRSTTEVLLAAFNSFTERLKARPGFVLPKAQIIVAGQVAYDCELFAVSTMTPSYQGVPGMPSTGYQVSTGGVAMYATEMQVTLVRSQPNMDNGGRPPNPNQLTQASIKSLDDAAALTDVFWAAAQDDSLAGACDTVYFGGVTFNGPMGEMLGTVLTMAVQL